MKGPSTATALGGHTWTELAAGPRAIVVVPLGSCEQHGPHLPLDTDTRVAIALCERLAGARDRVLVAAPLAIGASWEHDGFPGLLSITSELLAAVLIELGRSADWAAGLMFVNGHGGNGAGLRRAVETLRRDGRKVTSWSPRIPGGDAHAGETETSLLLHLAPDAVRPDRPVGYTGDLEQVVRSGVAAVSENGILGDASEATAARGAAVFETLVDDLLAVHDLAFGAP
ncbi:MAG: mycofactocin biosynthesis peptidyl-dipeptidase MftE [Ilumatobacteraceae bacterium]